MRQATSTTQKISRADGIRAIRFSFVLVGGARKSIVFDLVQRPDLDGNTYAQLESAALLGMVANGFMVESFTHDLIV